MEARSLNVINKIAMKSSWGDWVPLYFIEKGIELVTIENPVELWGVVANLQVSLRMDRMVNYEGDGHGHGQ